MDSKNIIKNRNRELNQQVFQLNEARKRDQIIMNKMLQTISYKKTSQ